MFQRTIAQQMRDSLGKPGTAQILYGARQVGKTTLVKQLLQEIPDAVAFNGDDLYTQSLLAQHELEHLKRIVGNATTIFIDEAQRIDHIGLTIKLLVDNLPVTVIASGSASFELADRLSEPLTGRARTFHLHPLAWEEVTAKYRMTAPETALEEMLRFGMYPRVHTLESNLEKEEYLYNYLNSYLYRDLLEFEQIKKTKKVVDLLVLLAHQIGKEVALSELSNTLGLGQKTVENYLDILEKMFVLVNIRGFSRNLRKEVTKSSRYYFVDVGLRNTLIRSFVPLSVRNDAGELFENWFVMERIKQAGNHRRFTGFYFWRTYDQHEIDL
ncbi:MAG: ATP-binding protein, partial [Syntrophales bacterium]|nr:ATP-binding protein [Syntrophales bacterium]